MRLLKINNTDVDIDDKTAIGLTKQGYDIKQPGKRFVNITNQFSIPITSKNLAIFGNASNPQNTSTTIYEHCICNFWVNNEQLIINAKCRVDEIGERISLFVFEKADIWDRLKEDTWHDFTAKFVQWMWQEKGLYKPLINPFAGTFADFIDEFKNSTDGLVLPFYYSNLHQPVKYSGGEFIGDNGNQIFLNYYYSSDPDLIDSNCGHFCAYVKTIFEYIEQTYEVNFLTAGGQITGNIWDDIIAQKLYIPMNEIRLAAIGTYDNCSIGFISPNVYGIGDPIFLPYQGLKDKEDKTLYDFVNAFFQHMNIIIDEIELLGEKVFALRRFDDIKTLANVEDFSKMIAGIPIFKPTIQDYAQNNYIRFKKLHKDLNENTNSKLITCGNKNIDYKKDLFSIDAYIPALSALLTDWATETYDYILDLSEQEAFKNFIFMLNGDLTDYNILVSHTQKSTINLNSSQPLYKAVIYELDSEYNFLEEILQEPKFYEIHKWLSLSEFKSLELFKQYYIRELNGSFFINKVDGFNPEKSNIPTKLELIKISDRTPVFEIEENNYIDGVDNNFIDGKDNNYIYLD
jgi:hypothetical protein